MNRKEFESMAPALRESIVRMVSRLISTADGVDIADDVAQDTMLKLWTKRDTLDSYRSIEALAMVIARNRVIDLMRQNRHDRSLDVDNYDSPDTSPGPHENLETKEADDTLSGILATLPSMQQNLIRMRHFEGMEIDDIAAVTGSTPGAVRVMLSRTRNNIKNLFMQQNK